MRKKIKASVIKDTIWINDSPAVQSDHGLLDGIPQSMDRYVKAVEDALPQLAVEDGVVCLEDVWLETSLPKDLLSDILKQRTLKWPANIERILLNANEFVTRPAPATEEEKQG